MKLAFVGTGAADWDWAGMPPGTRGSSAALLDGVCLIDAGPTVPAALGRAGADPAQIAHLVVTHGHSDHFRPATVAAIAAARRGRLTVRASRQVLDRLGDTPCERLEIRPGQRFSCGKFAFTTLPANHETSDITEETFHFFVESADATLLYALDGAWLLAKARHFLTDALRGRALDAVVWDATCGNTLHDWRFAEHNDLAMIDAMRASMLVAGLVSESTRHIFDHVARTLWPATAEECAALAESHGGILAEDGLVLDIPGNWKPKV